MATKKGLAASLSQAGDRLVNKLQEQLANVNLPNGPLQLVNPADDVLAGNTLREAMAFCTNVELINSSGKKSRSENVLSIVHCHN